MSDDRRKSSAQRGYGYRWQKYREHFLREHPLCVYCERLGKVTPATVVDHKVPHRGDKGLFWEPENHQALCKHCHDSVKKAEESGGLVKGCDTNGVPIDVRHHWQAGPTNG